VPRSLASRRSTASVSALPLAVCATPIGNLDDVTMRVLAELREADVVLCEDTRHTRLLLDRYGIAGGRRLLSYHEHNEAARTEELLPRLAEGERMALVSDAGLPWVNDPGGRLISAAIDRGVLVTVLPGPSAVETALVASGLAGDQYRFLGYLPRREAARRALWEELRDWPHPAVGFEAPSRLPSLLRSLAGALPDRRIAVCRELTKRFEEVVRGTAAAVSARIVDIPKGEITLVVGGAVEGVALPDRVEAAADLVRELVTAGVARRRAAELVAAVSGHSRNELYRASL
jgi:16S rRNA (cytidine1402-2'-O)-methyltransferase